MARTPRAVTPLVRTTSSTFRSRSRCRLPIRPTSAEADLPRPPILFIAREPDETLRTYLPIIAELRRREQSALVLFHHQPGRWALEQLSALETPVRCVALSSRAGIGGPIGRGRIGRAIAELEQLRRARQLARRLI